MRNLKDIITERLILSKNRYTLFPETREELEKMIESEIKDNGNKCSLNHIDVSEITDMSFIFSENKSNEKFNGDISKWDVSNVTNMDGMFRSSVFDGDISNWDVSNVTDMKAIFDESPLKNNPPAWYRK